MDKPARRDLVLLWLGGLVLVTLFLLLGRWQYQRGVGKQETLQHWAQAMRAEPRDFSAVPAVQDATLPQRIADRFVLSEAPGWILLDNQRRDAEVGIKAYRVLRAADGRWLLADFGWSAWHSRPDLPRLPEPESTLLVRGLWVPWPGQGIVLAANPLAAEPGLEPVLLTHLDRAELSAWSRRELAPGVLRVAPDSAFGFVRELDALPNTLPPEKHFGYALQWFGFALAACCILGILHWRIVRHG
jgi:cytochrome oxidase assembly protein ShyY1